MTTHMVRIYASANISKSDAESAIDSWVTAHDPWVEGTQESLSKSSTEPGGSGTEYYTYNARFHIENSTKQEVLDAIESELDTLADWYRLGYHECNHDEDAAGDCSWDDTRVNGDVPNDVPDFL